ncbi:hypothetical protein AAHA92_21985 [Salvia divinorum]|uniref:Uncharacterized protein n=1 Tax=Salvia divinorum TaxID=28513 RepID=A0ABD1GQ57_SALDI
MQLNVWGRNYIPVAREEEKVTNLSPYSLLSSSRHGQPPPPDFCGRRCGSLRFPARFHGSVAAPQILFLISQFLLWEFWMWRMWNSKTGLGNGWIDSVASPRFHHG